MTTTPLTDRYVDATLRRLPERQRPDIEQELRASIADAVDDRVEAGAAPADAERAALTELGDPVRLAAGYADRPLHLIGPAVYLDYTRTLTALIAIVVPVVAVVVGFTRAQQNGTVGAVLGGVIGGGLTAAVQVAFWTTALFVLIERMPQLRPSTTRTWTPDLLPELPTRRARRGELIVETVLTVLFAALVLVSPRIGFKKDADGDSIAALSPWLWDTGVVYVFLALIVVGLGFDYAKLYSRWNAPMAATDLLVKVAPSALLIWVTTSGHVVNPAIVTALDWSPAAWHWVRNGLIIVALFGIAHAALDTFLNSRAKSWETADLGSAIRSATAALPGVPRK